MGDTVFGPTIRQRRDALGLSQARLAELVGRSSSTIRNWERGQATPSDPADIVALAAILGTDEADLLRRAGFEPAEVETSPTMEQALAELRAAHGLPEADVEEEAELVEEEAELEATDEVPARAGPMEDASPTTEPVEVTPIADSDVTAEATDATAAEPVVEEAAPGPETSPKVAADVVPVEPPSRDVDLEAAADVSPVELTSPDVDPEAANTDAGAPPSGDWSTGERELTRAERRRLATRAAPPTVLETPLPGEPSYLEDPDERQRYRLRSIVTAAVVVVLVIVFLWALGQTTSVLGDMWQQIVDMISV